MSKKIEWRCCLYLSRKGDDDTQCMAVTFRSAFKARKFLDELLQKDGYVWETCSSPHSSGPCECTIRSESGIIVSTRWFPETMRQIVDHEYTLKEMAWQLQEPYVTWAKYFRHGPPQPRTLEEAGAVADSQRKRRAPSTPRTDAPAGYVHVGDVALSMGIEPKQARVALRKLFPDGKPSYGWYFDPAKLDELKTKIKGVVK